MNIDELTARDNPWNMLQQPVHASSGTHATFRALLAAVDQGWQVEEPVQALPTVQSDAWMYCFIILHPLSGAVCRLFIPALPEVEGYVKRSQYQVIEGGYFL